MSNQNKSAQSVKAVRQASALQTQAVKQRTPRPFAIRSDVRAGGWCYDTCYGSCMRYGGRSQSCQESCNKKCPKG